MENKLGGYEIVGTMCDKCRQPFCICDFAQIENKDNKTTNSMENKETIESICATLINTMNISVKLNELEDKIKLIDDKLNKLILIKKDVLNLNETCTYLDISASHLYKLTSREKIPHYCPQGKRLYFKRDELDKWLLTNKI